MMPYSIFPEHLFCRPRRHTLKIYARARIYTQEFTGFPCTPVTGRLSVYGSAGYGWQDICNRRASPATDAFCGSIPHANYLSRHFFSNFSRFFFNFTHQKLFVENTPSRKNISPSRFQNMPSLNNFSCQAKIRWQEWQDGGSTPATHYQMNIKHLANGDRSVCKFGESLDFQELIFLLFIQRNSKSYISIQVLGILTEEHIVRTHKE